MIKITNALWLDARDIGRIRVKREFTRNAENKPVLGWYVYVYDHAGDELGVCEGPNTNETVAHTNAALLAKQVAESLGSGSPGTASPGYEARILELEEELENSRRATDFYFGRVKELEEKIRLNERDAERYRWLRGGMYDWDCEEQFNRAFNRDSSGGLLLEKELDEVVDRLMVEQAGRHQK